MKLINEILSSAERNTHNDLSSLHDYNSMSVTPGEQKSLKNFTNWNHSKVINNSLANNQPMDQKRQQIHNDVQSAIGKAAPLQKPMVVHSGIDLARKKSMGLEAGNVVHTPSYTSTSLSKTNASLHATKIKTPAGTEKHHLHFHLPAGYKNGIFVGHKDKLDGDHEYIMNHNQNWKVANHTIKKGIMGTQHHHWDLHPHTEVNEEVKAIIHNGERIGHIVFNKNGYWEGKHLDGKKIHKAKTEGEIRRKVLMDKELSEMSTHRVVAYKKAVEKRIGGLRHNLQTSSSDFMKDVYQRSIDRKTKGLNMAKKKLGVHENTKGSEIWKGQVHSNIGVKSRDEIQEASNEAPNIQRLAYTQEEGTFMEVNVSQLVEFAKRNKLADRKVIRGMASVFSKKRLEEGIAIPRPTMRHAEERKVKSNLDWHNNRMNELIKQGHSKTDASAMAFQEMKKNRKTKIKEDVTTDDDDGETNVNLKPVMGNKTMTGKPKDKVKTDVWQPDANLSGVKSGV